MDGKVTIKRTYLKPYVERIYCSKCGKELLRQEEKDAKSIMLAMLGNENLQFHYRCEICGIDYACSEKYPKIGYGDIKAE